MPNPSIFLSKSKYLSGLQCPKLLWHQYNAKDLIPAIDAGTQAIFDQGHLVGEYARKIFREGIEVGKDLIEYESVVKKTYEILREMGVEVKLPLAFHPVFNNTDGFHRLEALGTLRGTLSPRKPLFEAAFLYKNAYARVDILDPVGKLKWDIIEVKSSTTVKEVNLHDLALQWYTYSGAGLTINKCYLMHINNKYVREGEIDPEQLFVKVDVTDQVIPLLDAVEQRLEEMVKVIAVKRSPEIPIGPHCSYPYECIMTEVCWKFLPKHNPHTLSRLSSKKAFALIEHGIWDVRNIDANAKLSEKQKIQIESVRTNKPHVEKEEIKEFLDGLEYPLYYLDFETIGSAVPVYDKTRPFEQIPFQFSLHIQSEPGARPEHVGFLAEGKDDPRSEFLTELQKHLGAKGTILTYNAPFEKGVLKNASAAIGGYSQWNEMIQARIVDLLDPFRAFHYYHPDQLGSASIKSVLPAITGKGYDGMAIADGGTASSGYLRVTFGEDVSEEERNKVRKNLVEYCTLDTMAMVYIVDELGKMVK